MFTGLIDAVGTLASRSPLEAGWRFEVSCPYAADVQVGESLAVNGVCLTAAGLEPDRIVLDVSPETLQVTTLGELSPGDPVNLERAMRLDGRMGGHLVQGHVDGTGRIHAIRPMGECYWVSVTYPPALGIYFVPRGSVTVDGISLTVAELGEELFGVQIVPHTWTHTTLGVRRPGDSVNLETDLIGKYVVNALRAYQR